GEGAATTYRDKVLKKMNSEGGGGQINVATGFYLFAWPISEFVNEFVGRMLDKEDTEDLTANHKVGALEMIASIIPDTEKHVLRLDQFAAQCGNTVSAATAAASLLLRERRSGALNAAQTKQKDDYIA